MIRLSFLCVYMKASNKKVPSFQRKATWNLGRFVSTSYLSVCPIPLPKKKYLPVCIAQDRYLVDTARHSFKKKSPPPILFCCLDKHFSCCYQTSQRDTCCDRPEEADERFHTPPSGSVPCVRRLPAVRSRLPGGGT